MLHLAAASLQAPSALSLSHPRLLHASYLVEYPQFGCVLCFLMIDSDYVYVAGMSQNHRSDSEFFLLHPIRWSVILDCSNIGDVYFESLIKVVSVRFLHC